MLKTGLGSNWVGRLEVEPEECLPGMVSHLDMPIRALPEGCGLVEQQSSGEPHRLQPSALDVRQVGAVRVRYVGSVANIEVINRHVRLGGSMDATL
jgi:hypothetical protein